MPVSWDGLDIPKLMEFRGIRGGERNDNVPSKTPLRIRQPLRSKGGKLEIDEVLMNAVARRLGVDPKRWAEEIKEIPVYVVSDKIDGSEGIVYVERAVYRGRKPLCASAINMPTARRTADVIELVKNPKAIPKALPKALELECNDKCPLWLPPESTEKSACKWRAVVTVQLQDAPMFPSPVRFRTHGRYTIRALLASLRSLAGLTGGVLMGIPLLLRQVLYDTFDAKGEPRRIPVVFFDFKGTVQELRAHALKELQSRKALADAHDGKFTATTFVDAEDLADDIDEGEEEPLAGGNGAAVLDAEKTRLTELSSQVALAYSKLKFEPPRQRALEDKHQGDLEAVLHELQVLMGEAPPSADQFAPGEVGAVTDNDDDLDDIFN